MENVDIKVGHGAVLNTGIATTIVGILGAITSFITTLTEVVPPEWGVALTGILGVIATVSSLITGLTKVRFAAVKADLMRGQNVLPHVTDAFRDDKPVSPDVTA